MSLPLYSYDDDGGDYEDQNTSSCYTSCNHRKDTCLWEKGQLETQHFCFFVFTSLTYTRITTSPLPNNILPFSFWGKRVGVKSLDIIAVVDIASTLAVVSFLSRGSVQMDGDVVVLALVIGSRMFYLNIIPVRGFSKN